MLVPSKKRLEQVETVKPDLKQLARNGAMKEELMGMGRGSGKARLNVATVLSESVGNLKIDKPSEQIVNDKTSQKLVQSMSPVKSVPRIPFKAAVTQSETCQRESSSISKDLSFEKCSPERAEEMFNSQKDTSQVSEADFDDMPELELAIREGSPDVEEEVEVSTTPVKTPSVSLLYFYFLTISLRLNWS